MKKHTRRFFAALAAVTVMFGSTSALPQLTASAVRSAAHIEAQPPSAKLNFIEKLPDVSELTEIGSLTMTEDETGAGFTTDEKSDILDGAEVFYLYIPESIGVIDATVHLELSARGNGSVYPLFEADISAQPLAGPCVCRIDAQYDIAAIGLYGKSMNVLETINGAVCEAHLYRVKKEKAADPVDAMLKSIAAPEDSVPLVEVNRIESTAEKTTLSRSAMLPEYSLDSVNSQVGIAAEHQYGHALLEYNDPQINWDDDSSEVRGTLSYTVMTVKASQPAENDGEKPIAYIQDKEDGIFGGKLEQGRFEQFTETNLLNCTTLELEAEFTMGTTVPDEDGLALLPLGNGKINILSGDCIEKPYQNYCVHLVHDGAGSTDNTNYAELIFRAMVQQDGEWKEMNRFTVGADMRDTDGSASLGWASIPNDILKPDNGVLYLMEPHFYAFTEDDTKEEMQEGIGYAALCAVEKTAQITMGDVNCDGAVDVSDAVLAARFCAEDTAAKVSDQGIKAMDVNGDAHIDSNDITCILRMIARLPIVMVN